MKLLINKIKLWLSSFFLSGSKETIEELQVFSFDKLVAINTACFYDENSIIFFNEINSYGVFKYQIVNEILHSNDFGVSDFHISLNKIYFQSDSKKHLKNKKTAISHLGFASKNLQFDDISFINEFYTVLRNYFPKNEPFDIVKFLIQPLILTTAFDELGLLEPFKNFNPQSEKFDLDELINLSNEIFLDRNVLENLIKQNVSLDKLPKKVNEIIHQLNDGEGVLAEDLPKFLATLIFVISDSTTSFVNSLVFFVLKEYPFLVHSSSSNEMTELANELLRLYTPTPYVFRKVQRDMHFHDIPLKKGDSIVLFLGAANRDPSVFVEPNEIIFGRKQRHLAFGRGHFSCIGEYAAFRLARNIITCLSNDSSKIEVITDKPNFILIPIVKIKEINVIYHD